METNKIKKYIEKRGLTIPEAAKAVGITRQHMWAICNGRHRIGAKLALRFYKWSGHELNMNQLIELGRDFQ